ncbi:MAG: asparaginase domain-containing protein [Treponema sp.]|nr:asparaginase domain-containing protein [Treponema sp.]
MYKSFVYLETRILLEPVASVFIKKDDEICVDTSVLNNVLTLVRAFDSSIPDTITVERLTGNLPAQPEGKKITGYSLKIAEGGRLDVMFHSRLKSVHIEEIRIEEDAGHMTHADGQAHMDFTWAGCPSIRIKTTPSFELGEEAGLFLNELRRLCQYLNLVNRGAAEGAIRSNAFVALARYPELPDYYIKLRNLNSFNFVRKAINFELDRQEVVLSSGGDLQSESRIWNERQSRTEFYQSRKNELRRFEPLSPNMVIHTASYAPLVADAAKVELPNERRARLRKLYGISRLRAEFICDEKDRADFYEAAIACGADSMDTAHWMASELMKLLNMQRLSLADSKLTPQLFAEIIKKLTAKQIHSGIAKMLLQAVSETGEHPDDILRKKGIVQLAGKDALLPYVRKVIADNPTLCSRMKNGEMAPLEYLTGLVMKKTCGMAVPQQVKTLIKDELQISVIYILNMGGAMTAVRHNDGSISGGDPRCLKDMLSQTDPDLPVQVISVRQFLSEEIEPQDWGALISEISHRITAGIANGIVITHGTDTLSYTAALLFWLFSDADVPIVLTASSSLAGDSDETRKNLSTAARLAQEKKNGVYVVYNSQVFSPLNLRFEKPSRDGFKNLALTKPLFTESGPVAQQFASLPELEADVLSGLLHDASEHMFALRMYPGFRSDIFGKLLGDDSQIKVVFLELYEAGTVNMRDTDYSVKPLLYKGHRKGVRFYCTSQQESGLNFSQYVTGMGLWREGAVPMGMLSTESAIALYFACSLVADSDAELEQLLENYAEMYAMDAN